MKFTLSWLKDHLDTHASLDDISKTLTAIGLEVESLSNPAESLKAFTVAKILEAEKHPEADKLRVCKVESDVGVLQIVCGAPNARAGIFVALAKEGAHIPRDNFTIKKTKIRGVESNGMLCSADELGLGGDSAGIIELPEAKIGAPIADVLGLNDPVIEINLTPNRADCLGVRGIARDLAAAGLGTLLPLPLGEGRGEGSPHPNLLPKGEGIFSSPISVSISTPVCQQFIGCYIKGVKNGPSPEWLKKRLEAIGQKPISALVDISNYLTIDLGRPMHMYDAKKLRGTIVVRDAKEGEKLKALNGKEYELVGGMCVIADDSGPVAIAGIIGGEATGCMAETTDVFLEVALFEPAHIASTGRALQIDTDARYRFERGVDPESVQLGAKAALSIINQLCGGEASELVIAGKTPEWKRSVPLRHERIASLGGINIAKDKADAILKTLGFESQSAGWQPPSWRADIEGEADLVEEILRIHGYDNIPPTPLPKLSGTAKPALNTQQKRIQMAKRLLASRGMHEVCTWSFISEKTATQFGGKNPKLNLVNPIAADLSVMRPSLLPNLLDAAKRNAARGFKDLKLFEVGLQYTDITPDGQRFAATGIRTGTHTYYMHGEGGLKKCTPPLDAFDAKSDALAVLAVLGVMKTEISTDTPPWYHPGRSGAFMQGKNILGYFGEIHPGLAAEYDLEGSVAAFEIFLDAIPQARAKGKARAALKLSEYQAVERDFAFVVDQKTTVADITKAINAAEKNLITSVEIFDVYAGKGVPEGKKSVAVKVTLQSFERTLTEQDIAAVNQAILTSASKFGGQLRS